MTPILLFLSLGTGEMLVILVVGLLLFGRRLPEVGRSLGKTFVEFKSGLQDMQAELREVDRIAEDRARRKPEPRPVDAIARGEALDAEAPSTSGDAEAGATEKVDEDSEPRT